MSERPWYKRYPSNFISGTLGLTLEEKGAYSLVLDMIYDRGGPIADDARYIAGVCNCSVRKWRAIRASLIEKGKITAENEFISNFRAEKELEISAKTARKHAENGAKGGEKSAEKRSQSKENKGLREARLDHTRINQKPEARYSVPNGTGLTSEFPDQRKQVFETALPSLKAQGHDERAARSIIGKWRKQCGNDDAYLLGKLAAAGKAQPANLVEWMAKAVPKSSAGFAAALDAMDEDLRQ